MCGIAGWFCWGEHRPTPGMAKALLMANLVRGRSAAGVAYRDADSQRVMVRKAPGPADDFIRAQPGEFWERVSQSPISLLHARATTKGSEKENENNHPVSGFGWVAVHNGHVANDEDLWDYYGDKRKRFAEVDTAAIPLVLSLGKDYHDSLAYLTLLSGSVSTAVWDAKNIDQVALVRLGGNPVYLFMDTDKAILYWTSAAIAGRIMPSRALDILKFPTWAQIPEGRLIVLKPGEPFTSELFKVERNPFTLPHGHKKKRSTGEDTKKPDTSRSSAAPYVAVGDDYPRMKWYFNPDNPKDKPLALLTTRDLKDFKVGKYVTMFDDFKKTVETTLRVDTAYGRWTLYKDKDGKNPTMYFQPRKAVRKFFLRHFKVGKKSWPSLPCKLGPDGKTPYDLKLNWEDTTYSFKPNAQIATVWQDPGYLCPWCGAWYSKQHTNLNKYRCDLCHIQSKPFVNYQG